MPWSSRRSLLEGAGLAVAGSLAGCTSRLPVLGRTETPDHWPVRDTAEADPVRWRLTHEYSPDFRPVIGDGAVGIGWRSPGKAAVGAVSMVEAKTGSPRSHRKLSYALMDQPVAHDGTFYLYTGVRPGQIWHRLQLRAFAPDGTERWKTERKDGRINFLDVGGGQAYLGTGLDHSVDSAELPLYAVSLADGTWRELGETGTTSFGVYHGGRLLLYVGSRTFASHDPSDGTEQWRADGGRLTDAHYRPVLASEVAFVKRRHGIAAIDLRDGTEIWEAELGDIVGGAAVGDGTVVVSPVGGLLVGLDATDGSQVWQVEIPNTPSQPLLVDGTVYVSDGQALRAVDAATGEQRWRIDSTASIRDYGRGMLVTVDDTESGEEIVARDVGDGTERWRYETPKVDAITVGQWYTYASVGDEGVVALGVR